MPILPFLSYLQTLLIRAGRHFGWLTIRFILLVVLVLWTFLAAGSGTGPWPVARSGIITDDGRPVLDILFFHDNLCETCQTGEKFTRQVYGEVIRLDLQGHVQFRVHEYRIDRANDFRRLKDLFIQYHVPAEHQQAGRYVFASSAWLSGEPAIDSGLAGLLQQESAGLTTDSSQPAQPAEQTSGAESTVSMNLVPSEDIWLYYFYSSPCTSCESIESLLGGLENPILVETGSGARQASLHLVRKNIADPAVLAEIRKYFADWNVPEESQRVPIVFAGSRYLSGSQAIQDNLPALIRSGQGLFEATTLAADLTDIDTGRLLSGFEMTGVFLTGLINGFNPCSMSMLMFFLSLLLARGTRLLRFGLAFLAGKFIAYTLLGTAAYSLLQNLGGSWFNRFQLVMKVFLVSIFLVLALANLNDFLAARSERYNRIYLQLPVFLRRKNYAWLKKLTAVSDVRLLLGVSFLAGLLISVGEFLCTGQIYLATILYVLNATGPFNWAAVSYFLLYVCGIILPLLVLTLVLHRGQALFLVSEAVRRQMPLIKLATALVFLGFAAAALFLY